MRINCLLSDEISAAAVFDQYLHLLQPSTDPLSLTAIQHHKPKRGEGDDTYACTLALCLFWAV
jgi:hypothetical protein